MVENVLAEGSLRLCMLLCLIFFVLNLECFSGRATDVSHTVPIYEDYTLYHATLLFAGRDLSMFLVTNLIEPGYSLTANAEKEIVPVVKEKPCYVCLDLNTEHKSLTQADKENVYDERFRSAKLLFPAQSPWQVGCRFSAVGSTDHFDWFMDYLVGFFTSSLVSYTEKLRSLNAVNMNSPVMHDAVSTQYELLPFHGGVPVAFPAPTKCIRFLSLFISHSKTAVERRPSVAGLATSISWVTPFVSGDTSHFDQGWQVDQLCPFCRHGHTVNGNAASTASFTSTCSGSDRTSDCCHCQDACGHRAPRQIHPYCWHQTLPLRGSMVPSSRREECCS